MTDIRYPSRALNSATDSVTITTSGGSALDVNIHDGAGTALAALAGEKAKEEMQRATSQSGAGQVSLADRSQTGLEKVTARA